jgi:diketogulonate reductase-like aldo/keto reductase
MPVLGFGTLIPDAVATRTATRDALEAGFRHLDCAEHRNEREVGDALQDVLAVREITREDLFITELSSSLAYDAIKVGSEGQKIGIKSDVIMYVTESDG